MKQIRVGVFETNSSSTHSLTIVTLEDYKKFVAGQLWFNRMDDKLVPPPENETNGDENEDECWDDDVISYEAYEELEYEGFEQQFTTPSGDKMVAFGYYGRDY